MPSRCGGTVLELQGGYNLGVAVIGFSLPPHHEYIRIGLHQMLSNYGSWWDQPFFDGILEDYVRFVDCKPAQPDKDAYMERYRFASADRSKLFFSGFRPDSLDFLFNQPRTG